MSGCAAWRRLVRGSLPRAFPAVGCSNTLPLMSAVVQCRRRPPNQGAPVSDLSHDVVAPLDCGNATDNIRVPAHCRGDRARVADMPAAIVMVALRVGAPCLRLWLAGARQAFPKWPGWPGSRAKQKRPISRNPVQERAGLMR